jgi:small-conductance mechanosensitive channel
VPDFDLLNQQVYGASVMRWLVAVATLAGVFAALAGLRQLLIRHVGKLAARSTTHIDDLAVELIQRTRLYFLLLLAVYAATRVVGIPSEASRVLKGIAIVLVLLQVGRWGNGLIAFFVQRYARLRAAQDSGARATIQAIGYGGQFVLWTVLLITALQNFGIDVTALVTGLGIGGIAIALAVQNILGDLFAALAIVLDKPFVVGDAIQVDNISGHIEHVGLKTTRIRALGGEQIIISNADLLKSRLRNYKRMEQRRAVFTMDLAFDTPPEKVAVLPSLVRKTIEAQPLAKFERCHWLTTEPTGIRLETVYFVLDPDYDKFADIQHAINLELLRRMRTDRIEFGYVTRTMNLTSSTQ